MAKLVDCDLSELLTQIAKRIKVAGEDLKAETDKVMDHQNKLQSDIDFLSSECTALKFQNVLYKSKESTYDKLIQQAEKDNKDFKQKFTQAHEFLQSETLRDVMSNFERAMDID